MYEKWRPVYTALAADTMDKLGYHDQAMDHTIRPSREDVWFAGPAITMDAYASSELTADPYGKIFEAYELMKAGDVVVPAVVTDEVHRLALEKLEGENTVRSEPEAGASPREVFDKHGIL